MIAVMQVPSVGEIQENLYLGRLPVTFLFPARHFTTTWILSFKQLGQPRTGLEERKNHKAKHP